MNTIPHICPMCHHHITPKPIGSPIRTILRIYEQTFHCNNPKCSRLFLVEYSLNSRSQYIYTKTIGPKNIKPIDFNYEISELSQNFVKIYNQATEAESNGLDEISGIGYRKALEFLIKDYCISKDSEQEENIKSKFLGKVINEDLSEAPKLQSAARKAVWLGNDETHYVRKWENKDISDLKKLIHITVLHIEYELELEQYEEDMQ